ncbi:MAG TPA: serine/threonine-protein kinase [Kofleriaceae bacterium]
MAEPGDPVRDPSFAATAPADAIVDRRLSDSNQAWLGKIVDGRYRVLEVIGRGGMGVVYRVEHLRMGKIAAMKVLHRDLAADPEIVRRFEREAHAVSQLHHPHTVQVFDFGQFQTNLYLIMELVRGMDLARVVMRDGPVRWSRAAPLFVQICGALQEAHEVGIVHRDLKPENVLITRTTGGRDFAKVLDFGLAKLNSRNGDVDTTDKASIVGTPYFMAPEQIRGEEVDARTDIYSMGALMFEVLTGKHLYDSSTAVGVLTKHLTMAPDAPSNRAPAMGIPPEVDYIVGKALEREPADRWQSVAELTSALEEAYASTVTEATPHRSLASRALRSGRLVVEDEDDGELHLRRSDLESFEAGIRARRWIVGAISTLGLLGGAVAAVYLMTRTPPPSSTEREPNDEPDQATRIAAETPVTGFLGKRRSVTEGDRDIFVVRWPAGERRVVSVEVTAPPNIDVDLSINDASASHSARSDDNGVGQPEMLHRRIAEGTLTVVIAQTMAKDQLLPVENVSDPYTVTVHEEKDPGETEPNDTEADATPLVAGTELHGYFDTRDDVDLLRWGGDDGTYQVVVRGDKLPLAWKLADGKARTPGGASVTLHRGELIRLERLDAKGTGPLLNRNVPWSFLVTK